MPRASVIIWAQPEQHQLIRDALDEGHLSIASIGGPTPDDTSRLTSAFDAPACSDLRAAISSTDAELLWLAGPDPIEPDVRHLIRERRLRTVSCQPRPVDAPTAIADPTETTTTRFAPLMRSSRGYRRALDVLEQMGEVRTVQITFACDAANGTLLARLFDAVDIIENLAGNALTIHAVGTHRNSFESLETMVGDLSAVVRFGDARTAGITVSATAGPWLRRVLVIAAGGRLMFTDTELEWVTPAGEIADRHHDETPVSPGRLIGWQIRRWLDEMDSIDHPPDNARLIALCEATRLSCRTGQPESPARMLELMGRP